MVEGAHHQRSDSGSHRIDILQHFAGGETPDPISVLSQKYVANRIPLRTRSPVVRFAINLDDQSGLRTIKVHNIRPYGVLPTKLSACLAAA